MTKELTKGENGPLAVNQLLVSVQLNAPADLSALLVEALWKVVSYPSKADE